HQFFDHFVAEQDSLQHHFLGNLVTARLHHVDGVLRAGDNQMHVAFFHLLDGGIDHKLPVHPSDNHSADGAIKGNVGNGKGGGGAEHGRNLGRTVLIDGKNRRDHLHFIPESLREQRADRAVNQTAGENRLFAGTAFPLDESAGNLPDGVQPLLIV